MSQALHQSAQEIIQLFAPADWIILFNFTTKIPFSVGHGRPGHVTSIDKTLWAKNYGETTVNVETVQICWFHTDGAPTGHSSEAFK